MFVLLFSIDFSFSQYKLDLNGYLWGTYLLKILFSKKEAIFFWLCSRKGFILLYTRCGLDDMPSKIEFHFHISETNSHHKIVLNIFKGVKFMGYFILNLKFMSVFRSHIHSVWKLQTRYYFQ